MGCKDKVIRKSEFVAKTQFLLLDINNFFLLQKALLLKLLNINVKDLQMCVKCIFF